MYISLILILILEFRCFNSQFSRDANTLEKSIRDLKVKAGELPKHDADVEVIKIHDRMVRHIGISL